MSRVDRSRNEAMFREVSKQHYYASVEWYTDKPCTEVIVLLEGHVCTGTHLTLPDGLIAGILRSKGYTVTPPASPEPKDEP